MTNYALSIATDALHNVLSQAKRLRDLLDIPLTEARNILAQSAYRCKDWNDLRARIDAGPNTPGLQLATLPSGAEQPLLRELELGIARAIGSRVLANVNLAGMLRNVRQVFGRCDEPVLLSDVVPALEATPWQSARIGPDPLAVLECDAVVNGRPLKLIATRVYLPAYMAFPEDMQALAWHATVDDEPVSIIWEHPEAWHGAACRYIDNIDADGDVCADFESPASRLDARMREHERWFTGALLCWKQAGTYGEDRPDTFRPYLTNDGAYFIFGIPAVAGPSNAPHSLVDARDKPRHSPVLVHLHGQALALDHIDADERDGCEDDLLLDFFQRLKTTLLNHPQHALTAPFPSESGRLYYLTPSSDWQIDDALRLKPQPEPDVELVMIRTDHVGILDCLLANIASRKVMKTASRNGLRRYFTTLEVDETGVDGFSFALEVKSLGSSSAFNLVTTTICTRTENHCSVAVELLPQAFSLYDRIGRKRVMAAARDGMVLREDPGFGATLEILPVWCEGFDTAAPEVIEAFSARSLEGMSIVDLWAMTSRTTYRRDSF